MKISEYNPVNMALISDDTTGIDFGSGVLGGYCKNAVAIRPISESENLTELALYLENKAGLNHTHINIFQSPTPVLGITPGDEHLSDSLYESPGVSDLSQYPDNKISYNPEQPEYTWLDANIGLTETVLGISSLNFRFIFEYN